MCFAASVWLSGLEEELVVFLTLPHAVNSSRSRCIRPSRASSGFDEDFPTSGSPHLPARRRPALLFFSLSLSSWKLCSFFLRSSQWSNPEIFIVLMRFKRCHRRNLLLKFQVKQLFENIGFFFPLRNTKQKHPVTGLLIVSYQYLERFSEMSETFNQYFIFVGHSLINK